jgi:hypothetical protein
MKKNTKMIIALIVVVILACCTFFFFHVYSSDNNDWAGPPVVGWLFELDTGQLFFVTTTPTYHAGVVLTEEQISQIIGEDSIIPATTQISLTSEEAKAIVLDYLNEINCSESIEIGEIELIEYRSKNPYQAYIQIYKSNETVKENYGVVTVSITGKYVAIPSLYCIQGEAAFDFTIPDNSSSKEILLNHMLNNNIQNNITNEYYMMYYANDLEFMRSILGE